MWQQHCQVYNLPKTRTLISTLWQQLPKIRKQTSEMWPSLQLNLTIKLIGTAWPRFN